MELNIKFDEKMLVATANRVLDEYEYNGKTIREWADIISNPRTNADRIRSMTDEELASFLNRHGNIGCSIMGKWESGMCSKPCAECWLEWLRQEAE